MYNAEVWANNPHDGQGDDPTKNLKPMPVEKFREQLASARKAAEAKAKATPPPEG